MISACIYMICTDTELDLRVVAAECEPHELSSQLARRRVNVCSVWELIGAYRRWGM